jgi:hypothetical protein
MAQWRGTSLSSYAGRRTWAIRPTNWGSSTLPTAARSISIRTACSTATPPRLSSAQHVAGRALSRRAAASTRSYLTAPTAKEAQLQLQLANFHREDEATAQETSMPPTGSPSSPGRGSFLRPYHHKGARRVTHHGFGHATEKRPLPSAATMTADDEEVRRPLLSSLDNLVGRPADLKEFQDG